MCTLLDDKLCGPDPRAANVSERKVFHRMDCWPLPYGRGAVLINSVVAVVCLESNTSDRFRFSERMKESRKEQ